MKKIALALFICWILILVGSGIKREYYFPYDTCPNYGNLLINCDQGPVKTRWYFDLERNFLVDASFTLPTVGAGLVALSIAKHSSKKTVK
jgi:hypothetical protein